MSNKQDFYDTIRAMYIRQFIRSSDRVETHVLVEFKQKMEGIFQECERYEEIIRFQLIAHKMYLLMDLYLIKSNSKKRKVDYERRLEVFDINIKNITRI